jgi:beta-galactosidase
MPRPVGVVVCCLALVSGLWAQEPKQTHFLFGASVYPDLQTREEWNRMLDEFQKAHMDVVRVSESSWGNLETAPGQYNFGWLRDFLDDLARRNMKAVLGTSSYVPPQWLAAGNPEILMEVRPGVRGHPMARHSPCLNHPVYREALRQYLLALGKEFKDHPAVIGWQLGNEMEFMVPVIDYNPAAQRAWTEWLKQTYHTPEEFNRRLDLVSWGMKVRSLDEVPQPGEGVEESGKALAALTLAHRHFRRDVLLDFFIEQRQALREAGVKHWITTDWNTVWHAVADDPLAPKALDVSGLNFYHPAGEAPDFWMNLAWHLDMHRSAHGLGHFLVTETTIGTSGYTFMENPFPSHDQFRLWMLQPVAFGASALMYWSGNRWHGGHWPHWGGLLDWTGQPELDFPWVVEMGEFYQKWGPRLLQNPVEARAVVLTDFDQRAALEIYPHTQGSEAVLAESFDAFHRLGMGVDSMNLPSAEDPSRLQKYSLVVIPAATALDGTALPAALKQYVEAGGNVLITPFTAYQSWDGIFRRDGFGANLMELAGVRVRTARKMGTSADQGRKDQQVVWTGAGMKGPSPVGVSGYCEIMEVQPGAEIIAQFKSDEPLLEGRPAATRKKLGKGTVFKLAFWPKDDSFARLIGEITSDPNNPLAAVAPPGVQAVPRTDGSMFLMNTSGHSVSVQLGRTVSDRISGRKLSGRTPMQGYEVIWVE